MNTICIIDDHKLFSNGLELMLGSGPFDATCMVFDDPDLFLMALAKGDAVPDLYIIDYYIPGSHGPDLIRRVREAEPDSRIMIVSASINPVDQKLAIGAGADLFMSKSVDPPALLDAVASLLAGRVPDATDTTSGALSKKFDLTPRQLETLLLVSKGFSNKEIAGFLDVSPETVKSHLKDIFLRFGVANRMEAIDLARNNGLV